MTRVRTAAWLRENGYDGLAGYQCGCGLDDLMPCSEPFNCVPGHRRPATAEDAARCECEPGDIITVPGKGKRP